MPPIDAGERTRLAQRCLEKGRLARLNGTQSTATSAEITALAQAKIAFVETLLQRCAQHQVRAIASIVDARSPRPAGSFLRKDYAYLFERFYYWLDEQRPFHQGLVVFDELERSKSHVLIGQMSEYFQQTAKGKQRSSRIIPEPFFVHSHLTTLVQIADIVAYVVSFGVRVANMSRPARQELEPLATAVCDLRHRATRERRGDPFYVWSFAVIDDLRPKDQQDDEET